MQNIWVQIVYNWLFIKEIIPMRCSFLALIISFLCAGAVAQKKAFSENFLNKSNGWLIYNGSQVSCNLQKGSYSMRNGSDASVQMRTPYFLSTANEFLLSTGITVKGGNDQAWNGFYINADSISYQFTFTRSGAGQLVKINGKTKAGDTLVYKSRVKKIKGESLETNTLAIKVNKGELNFTINKGKVGTIEFKARRITEIGYVLAPRNDIRVETFEAGNKPSIKRITLVNDSNILTAERSTLLATEFDEAKPVVSPDGKLLFITSENRSESVNLATAKRSKDIYFLTKRADGGWNDAKHAGYLINNDYDNEVVAISADNETLLITGKYKRQATNELYEGDLFFSTKEYDGSWSYPEPVYIISKYLSSAVKYNGFTLSASGKTLLMSMKRDDSNGGFDLYASFSEDGSYFTEPVNLGAQINTVGDETAPCIAADGTTLYFSSTGYNGYGQSDIYISKRQGDSWDSWSSPENMGPAINSPLADLSFSTDASGEYAYISSAEGAVGETDIFRVTLPESIRPQAVAIIYGKVLDAQTSEPLITTVRNVELPKRTETASTLSSINDGSFALAVPVGRKYEISAKEKGYFALSEKLDLSQKTGFNKIERNLYLFPIKTGEPIRLGNRYFELGAAEFNSTALEELEKMIGVLSQNPGMRVMVEGSPTRTLQLEREKAVSFYLYTQGINPVRTLLRSKKK